MRHLPLLLLIACTGASDETDTDMPTGPDTDVPSIDITPDGNTYGALVRGTLFTDDLVEAQSTHDAVAAGGEEAARAFGDLAHDAMIGLEDQQQFLGLDLWDNLNGMNAIYSDPDFQAAFATLFEGPPSVEIFVEQPTWESWGDHTTGDPNDPHFFVVVRGRLVEADPADAQAAHDSVAGGARDDAIAAGDLAHVAHTGLEDPQEFFGLDIWADAQAMGAFYANPDLQAAFGTLFEAPPEIVIYQSTDWHQW